MVWLPEMRLAAINILKRVYVDVGPELNFNSPLQLLIAVILSAQSTDKQVNKVTAELFKRVVTVDDLLQISEDDIIETIKGVGIYRNKAKHLVQLAMILATKYDGKVPQTIIELETLPGVGHKTANVVASIAFGVPALAVDTHVFRVGNRLGLCDAQNVRQAELQLTNLIDQTDWSKAHHWLIHLGRYCCKAQRPLCLQCALVTVCRYYLQVDT